MRHARAAVVSTTQSTDDFGRLPYWVFSSTNFWLARFSGHAPHAEANRRTPQEILQLDTENHSLSDQVKALKTDPKAIERMRRDDMGLARPGEYIFKFPAAPDSQSQNAPSTGRTKICGTAKLQLALRNWRRTPFNHARISPAAPFRSRAQDRKQSIPTKWPRVPA